MQLLSRKTTSTRVLSVGDATELQKLDFKKTIQLRFYESRWADINIK